MAVRLSDLGGLVYSTEAGRMCPDCRQPVAQCQCKAARVPSGDGVVRVSRETKGRGGKAVTVVRGVLLAGVEPHLRYATFADAIVTVAQEMGCEIVVTLGASPEAIPHTRPPQVVGSSTSPGLIRALGLSRPQYQGVTGLMGVLQERLERNRLPAVSLRVGVPHYLGNAKHPQASIALLRHLEHVLGIRFPVRRQVQAATGERVELAFVDQGDGGEQAAEAAAGQGLRLEVVRLPDGKRGFVRLPR